MACHERPMEAISSFTFLGPLETSVFFLNNNAEQHYCVQPYFALYSVTDPSDRYK